MRTEILKVDPQMKAAAAFYKAAQLLDNSELVAFPTETVYGLGAKVSDEAAVRKIFSVKGRAKGQALLVHISQIQQLSGIVENITPDARLLMDEFWPGPLSIILRAHKNLSPVVTGGKSTVGLRMPSHPVARNLIDITGPLAATSANYSGSPSPLNAAHVKEDLNGLIAAIVEGGPTLQGIESTIIDLSQEPYRILRRGTIGVSDLERVLGKQLSIKPVEASKEKPYKSSFVLHVARDKEDFQCHLEKYQQNSLGIIYFDYEEDSAASPSIEDKYILALNENGSKFFSILRDAEQKNLEILLMAPLPDSISEALRDRINRAAHLEDKGAL